MSSPIATRFFEELASELARLAGMLLEKLLVSVGWLDPASSEEEGANDE